MSGPDLRLRYPRITIEFCVQCKWNLRAAYFAQELLQTFSTSIGEISMIPVTGGIFTITLYHKPQTQNEAQLPDAETTSSNTDQQSEVTIQETLIWDRKRDGGFPETKELKNLVRNVIEPGKDMGHVDRALKKGKNNVDGGSGGERKEREIVDGTNIGSGITDGKNESKDEGQPTKQSIQNDVVADVGHLVQRGHVKQHTVPPADCEDCK